MKHDYELHRSEQFELSQRPLDTTVPVIILGGKENSLSLTRHLADHGISVYVSGPGDCLGLHSRRCRKSFCVPRGMSAKEYWTDLLVRAPSRILEGAVIFPCSDEAIEFVAEHQPVLERSFILDGCRRDHRSALLDKQRTLELANKIGVPAPQYWPVKSLSDVEKVLASCTFPMMVKPLHTHRFSRVFGCKLFIVERDAAELREKIKLSIAHGFEVMAVEMIPGPDDLLSSYYTYIDQGGEALFHFTKRVVRRFPVNRGSGTCHMSEWLPKTAAAGLEFFKKTDFTGLGNIEFKRDPRDGVLKIIEVNARFTAAHRLAVKVGAPMDVIIYCRLTGQHVPRFGGYRQQVQFWYPIKDLLAFFELRRAGSLSFWNWLRSIVPYRRAWPVFSIADPLPLFFAVVNSATRALKVHI